MAHLFQWLIQHSIELSLVLGIIVFIRWVARRWIAPRLRAALWLILFLKILLPILPESSFSLYQLTSFSEKELSVATSGSFFPTLTLAIWILGILFLSQRYIYSHKSHISSLRNAQCETPQQIRDTFRSLIRDYGLRGKIQVRLSHKCQSPFLVGIFQPVVYLPATATSWTEEKLKAVLGHELAHYKRHDHLWEAVATTCQLIHWFNPALRFALNYYRNDRELATDALALSLTSTRHRHTYGLTLLQLSTSPTQQGTLAFSDRHSTLRERIKRISTFRFGEYDYSLPALAFSGICALLLLTAPPTISPSSNLDPLHLKAANLEEQPAEAKLAPLGNSMRISTSVVLLKEE